MEKKNLTWKDVFNADLKPTLWGLDQAATHAAKAGYKYMTWNGRIIDTEKCIIEKDITVKDLDNQIKPAVTTRGNLNKRIAIMSHLSDLEIEIENEDNRTEYPSIHQRIEFIKAMVLDKRDDLTTDEMDELWKKTEKRIN